MKYIQQQKNNKILKTAAIFFAAVFLVIITITGQNIILNDVECNADEKYNYSGIIDDALFFECQNHGVDDVQHLLDDVFSLNPTNGTFETFVQAIYEYDNKNENVCYDYDKYSKALSENLDDNDLRLASLEKAYITRNLFYSDYVTDNEAKNQLTSEENIMALIYGLLLFNSENNSMDNNALAVAERLVELQLEEGGFAYSGNESDVDVTAMAITSLAGYIENKNIEEAVNSGLAYLSKVQLSEGDFESYGVATSESTSQVIIAIYEMGILCDDSRFVKDGNSAIDGLLRYKNEDGGFAHTYQGKSNEMATSQAVYALSKAMADTSDNSMTLSVKIITVIAFLALLYCVYVLIKAVITKKFSEKIIVKRLLGVIIIAAMLCGIVYFLDIESTKEHRENTKNVNASEETITVSISISCETICGMSTNNKNVDLSLLAEKDYIILPPSVVTVTSQTTVSEILQNVCSEYNIQLEQDGISGGDYGYAYVRGIDYLYELDFGDLSGWMYYVNGEAPSVGCGSYTVSEGDVIEWKYTCNLGKDL